MKAKTAELTGAALDWAVAKCEGIAVELYAGNFWADPHNVGRKWQWKPHADWAQGGPIIERERISLWTEGYDYEAKIYGNHDQWGQTPLIAAMRCFVASRLGDEVEIPEELTMLEGERK